ncbi:unnamed protein product [Rhizophagus irregularis]|uniref:TIR domain-containing protein n=1 Tax=Rhizophagus irregularis TaxID=588596 RepID=A0A915Z5M0_9GLOM|nr:unnamed protein product [Rhizophagus irregularis]
MLSPRNLEEPGYQSPRNLKETGNIDVFIAYRTSDAEKFISWNARWMERSQPLRQTGLIQEECQKPDFGRKGTLDEVTNRLPKLVFSISLTAGLRFRNEIHTCGPLWTCGITRTTGMNSFSRFSSQFLEQLFTTILNNFLWFLDDSWTIRMDVDGDTVKLYYCRLFYCFRLLDDLNNIIFFMAFEQFLGETSWFFGWET